MSEYQKKLDELYKLEFFGMKLGLDNIRALLYRIGNPHRQFESVHVAGTNGKGSVCAMLAAVHQTAGKRTGLYTSPHLVHFGERISINGKMISEQEILSFLERVWPIVEELNSTFFEVTTAMAFDHFGRHHVDIAIIETGLGGRLDATNIIEKPLATVVTSIGHDHHAQLGPTLEDIAREKAGIFKEGVPAIVHCQTELRTIFEKQANTTHSLITFVSDNDLRDNPQIIIPFAGKHQAQNVQTVLSTLEVLPYKFSPEIITKGIEETSELTGWRARLEEIEHPELKSRGIQIFLDVGHNPEAAQAVSEFFKNIGIRPLVIFGIMQDKDVDRVLQIISGFATSLIAVSAATSRALPSSELAQKAEKAGISAVDGRTVRNALKTALSDKKGKVILISGSHYIVGEFLGELSKGILSFNLPSTEKPAYA